MQDVAQQVIPFCLSRIIAGQCWPPRSYFGFPFNSRNLAAMKKKGRVSDMMLRLLEKSERPSRE